MTAQNLFSNTPESPEGTGHKPTDPIAVSTHIKEWDIALCLDDTLPNPPELTIPAQDNQLPDDCKIQLGY